MFAVISWGVGCVVLLTTALPLTNSVHWWVRMWDFPRLHIACVALVVIVLACLVAVPYQVVLVALMATAVMYQAVQIFPYTRLVKTEIDLAAPGEGAIRMMSVNVLMENTCHADLASIILRENPDVLLLMETDQIWCDALAEVLIGYKTFKAHLTDDHYGMIFATRLESKSVEFMWPDGDDTPALKAILRARDGTLFNFIGLHPRPPVPGNDTKVRDRQIKDAALMTSSSDRPTVCMGDFNDVAWSWTTRRFKRYANFLEPRVGRGMIASFHAQHWFMRLPIDQIFLTEDVNLVAFSRLEDFGSDHFPMTATVFFNRVGDERAKN